MGFLKKLFGGGDKAEKAPPPPVRRSAPPPSRRDEPAAPAAPPAPVSTEGATAKQLIRMLGADNEAERETAAKQLASTKEITAVRPLINCYLNYGDQSVLEAMRAYGPMLTTAATKESVDRSIIGQRRVRLLDILGATADPECMNAAREWIEDDDYDIRTHACDALVRMGDLGGIDTLSSYLQLTDHDLRFKSIQLLRKLTQPQAKKVLDDHIERYLAEAGAIPMKIEISAPRLANPELEILKHITDHIKKSPHALTVAIGSGAVNFATSRSEDVAKLLDGYQVHLTNRRTPPEEQIASLEKARDEAASGTGVKAVLFGILPSPHDSPPLPNFLIQRGHPFNAKVIVVDPHEYSLIMDWWHAIEDSAQVPTDFEVILSTSLRDKDAVSAEEVAIYELTPDDKKATFARALLAHM